MNTIYNKQEVFEQIKTIKSAIGLSGYYSSLPKVLREDEEIKIAFKERRKEL